MLTRDARIRLARARDRLEALSEPPLSIREIAREAKVSPYHFIRLFEATFGWTPHQYRIRSRLEHAKRMLAVGGASVTETCLDCGFASLGSFSDLFTRRVGVAPSAYRRLARPWVQSAGIVAHAFSPGCFSLMAGPEGIAIFEKHSRHGAAYFATC
jgi:AraC-like DNA-binding protein